MIRNPAVAGSFYYYDPQVLYKQIDEFVDKKARKENALGVMSPHAGYVYSGRIAAKVYSKITPADTYIILGPNHTGMGAEFAIMREGEWRTPLGNIKVNSQLAEDILVHSRLLENDFLAHQREHSIEVQVPFMQYFGSGFQIVPITVAHYPPTGEFLKMLEDVSNAIASAVKKTREKVTIVASTDLTHYEPQDIAREKDKAAMDAILSLDESRLFNEIRSKGISMCGYGPTAVMLQASKKLGANKTERVGYMTSGDTTGDYEQVVGYGGIIVR